MDIIKFSEYLLESVELPILDIVIDNDGKVYNGLDGSDYGKLTKGRIEKSNGIITSIKGPNNEFYPAGIDKNGNLVAVDFKNGKPQTFIDPKKKGDVGLPDSEKETKDIPINQALLKKYKKGWIEGEDYYDLVPITPTGWVNVKVDMEIVKRVRRYSKAIGTHHNGYGSFLSKLEEFQRISKFEVKASKKGAKKKRRTIQSEMSVIILLHYINEIKDFFTPSSSGFLFESFIAGLIPNARVKEDNTAADIIVKEGSNTIKYQIKLISADTKYVDLVKEEEWKKVENKKVLVSSEFLDYYVICLKNIDTIDVYILKGVIFNELNCKYTTAGKKYEMEKYTTPKGFVKYRKKVSEHKKPRLILPEVIKDLKDKEYTKGDESMVKFKIDLTRIESRIESIGSGLKSSLDKLYDEISNFQYNVETLITGTKADGSIVKEQDEFEQFYNAGVANVAVITNELAKLRNSIEVKGSVKTT
jgi:hypothetical protein